MDLLASVTCYFTEGADVLIVFLYSVRKAAGDECNESDEELKRSKMVRLSISKPRVSRIIYVFLFLLIQPEMSMHFKVYFSTSDELIDYCMTKP